MTDQSQTVSTVASNGGDGANVSRDIHFADRLLRASGILHLGAHFGQEAATYAQYDKPVLWVEALPHIYASLEKNIQQYHKQRALCALLGNRDGEQKKFYVSNNMHGVSSSMFPFGEHGSGDKSLWPQLKLAMEGSVTLSTIRLDTLMYRNDIDVADYDFWIVDLQGAELLALQGAGELLSRCNAMYVEISTVDVYRGGVLWPELRQWLIEAGFTAVWEPTMKHDDVLLVRNRA